MSDAADARTSGTLHGPLRRPRNLSRGAVGTIHDDPTAAALGFRGGTVAGNVHLVQLVPLLLEVFGTRWFETGSLSVLFRHATVDGEPVRAVVGRPARDVTDVQVAVRLELADGTLVAEGTAAVGRPSTTSFLRARDRRAVDPGSLTVLRDVVPGAALPSRRVRFDGTTQRRLLAAGLLTEPLDWYAGTSPWGGAVASPLALVDLLTAVEADLRPLLATGAVGLYGGIELCHEAGPVLLDTDYDVAGTVLAVGDTPRTEVLWYESRASVEGRPVASMLMMSRLVKQHPVSSPD